MRPARLLEGLTTVAFVRSGNAGRSRTATAFAEREREIGRDRRGLDVELLTGGTDPADRGHREVIGVMDEKGIDVRDREPRAITPGDLESATHVVTMGCSVEGIRPAEWEDETETWAAAHPSDDAIDAALASTRLNASRAVGPPPPMEGRTDRGGAARRAVRGSRPGGGSDG